MNYNEYEQECLRTQEQRIAWFKAARFGMFIHYGLFAEYGMGEWAQFHEAQRINEWEARARAFRPKEGCTDEWCRLAVEAGAKYAVMTTRHHEGFSLWDSKVNPFNSMNYCGRDLVREFCESCRKYGLKIGLYSSLMDWRHPDGWKCMNDPEARKRFTDYLEALNVELLSNYGKIDILWYDMPYPHMSYEQWDSVGRNSRLRKLQPDILINNRSRMHEDFYTPEETLNLPAGDAARVANNGAYWEACMTFNGFSWGYVDAAQAQPYAFSAQQIAKTLIKCTYNGGNLLLNIGPAGDGSVPADGVEPLKKLGTWLRQNGEALYGPKSREHEVKVFLNQVTSGVATPDAKTVYAFNYIWPKTGEMNFGNIKTPPRRITLLTTGEELEFEVHDYRIRLKNLPEHSPDDILGIAVLKLEFDEPFKSFFGCYYPQMTDGVDFSDGKGN